MGRVEGSKGKGGGGGGGGVRNGATRGAPRDRGEGKKGGGECAAVPRNGAAAEKGDHPQLRGRLGREREREFFSPPLFNSHVPRRPPSQTTECCERLILLG
jgi:hypothetical protein